MRLTRIRTEYLLVICLIILMPMHYVLFSLLLGRVKLLSLWRDAIIIILLVKSCKGGKLKLNRTSKIILAVCIMVIVFLLTNLSSLSLNIARTYIFPILIFLPLSRIEFSEKELNGIIRMLWVVSVAIAAYGIFQAYILGPSYLINLGYASENGRLASSSFYIMNNWMQQRITGTFVSPNNCGCYFAISLIILYRMKDSNTMKPWIYYTGLAIIALALIGTLSRSAWLGCIAGLFVTHKPTMKQGRIIKGLFAVILVIIVLVIVDRFMLDGRIGTIAMQQINNTMNKRDSSMLFHIRQLYEPLLTLLGLPFGYKFGTNGSFAIQGLSVSEVHLVESSYYTIAYEFGLVMAVLFFLPYVSIIKNSTDDNKGGTVRGIAVCLLIIYLVLPSIQAYEQPLYLFMFAGLFAEKKRFLFSKVGKIYRGYHSI